MVKMSIIISLSCLDHMGPRLIIDQSGGEQAGLSIAPQSCCLTLCLSL